MNLNFGSNVSLLVSRLQNSSALLSRIGLFLAFWLLNSSGSEVLNSNELGVIEQPLPPAFAAEAGFLVAAERRGRIEFVEGVRPDDAGLELHAHLQDSRTLVGPHPGAQSVRRVVRLLDRLLDR